MEGIWVLLTMRTLQNAHQTLVLYLAVKLVQAHEPLEKAFYLFDLVMFFWLKKKVVISNNKGSKMNRWGRIDVR